MQFFTQAANNQSGMLIDPLTIVMLLALAVLIFFMFRNNKKRKQMQAELESKMIPGARVMLTSGIFGELAWVDDEKAEAGVEIAPGLTIVVHRQALSRVVDDEAVADETEAGDAGTAQN